ncbi:hypothetical protein LTR78_005136 [Recurvomyces mirabilis]|uniref:Uncharacterized protein n=1 Tax=Recurvomyces mirabilis TaxID=574656 RepID=A0AAE0WN70_9PEZI|nr:hypothetical protein LTR78_005136 [Recurvomyces mirabilis]KAK5157686.1 hypothetical protein LTS14_003608 [Recurvomyces mirabilis]
MPYNPYFDPVFGPRLNPYARIMPVRVPVAVAVPVYIPVPVTLPAPAQRQSTEGRRATSSACEVNGSGYVQGEVRDAGRSRREQTQRTSRRERPGTEVQGRELVRQTQRREAARQTVYSDYPRQARDQQAPVNNQPAQSRYRDDCRQKAPAPQSRRAEQRTQCDNVNDRPTRRQLQYDQDRTPQQGYRQQVQPLQPIYEERYPPRQQPQGGEDSYTRRGEDRRRN